MARKANKTTSKPNKKKPTKRRLENKHYHSKWCAFAAGPVEDCECSCGGKYHGSGITVITGPRG